MKPYEHKNIEEKWQARWEEARVFAAPDIAEGEKGTFILDMFPYPSGSGLHVGHLLGYTGSDIISRAARMQGKKVLHPMGWDSFGLPAENYALKTGVHPEDTTLVNAREYKRQFKQAGIGYDWDKELMTSDPAFYKWTQWLFEFLYKQGLAYRKDGMVNWCPNDQTVLANEQVVNGHCERCGAQVIQKNLKQWYFKITEFAEELLSELDNIDWPEKIKAMQRNWIGKSEGAQLFFMTESGDSVEVFTTRPDTLMGATYLVLAPENPLVDSLTTDDQREIVASYKDEVAKKSELERLHLDKTKTGVWTGSFALHPITGEKLPIWIAEYVLQSYGTGAIMAVPAHDERDHEFASKYGLPIIQVIHSPGSEGSLFTGYGTLINSGDFTGLTSEEAKHQIVEKLSETGAQLTTTYRLRDWLVSRQRFWGAPIPIAYDDAGNEYLVPESELPVILPRDIEFSPTGQSPLATATEWRRVTIDGKELTREADTLDTFVCSSWYFLRFPNPQYKDGPFDPVAIQKWLPVEIYMGGAEHAVLHLLYARFITKALHRAGLITFTEPFTSLRNQGSILGPDHQKMSKSKGNVINPDDVIAELGADTLRTYEMFMAPFEVEKPWSTTGIIGVRRFLEKVWRLQERIEDRDPSNEELAVINKAIKKVTEDIEGFKFNTCVSTLMETVNALTEQQNVSREVYTLLVTILSPFAPHISEELWEILGNVGFICQTKWPTWNEKYLTSDTWVCAVQINGKVRAQITLQAGLEEAAIRTAVENDETVKQYLEGKTIQKAVVVPGRLVSLVVS